MEKLSLSTLIWLRMARFVQNSNQMSNTHLQRFDLTIAQFEALSHIRAFEPVTQSDLAKGLTVSDGGISRMVSRLEREGLITREQSWKTKHISLTQAGRRLVDEAYPAQLDFQAALFDEVLDEDEKTQLHRLMKKLYEHSIERRNDEEQP
ncbi:MULTISPECIES: MarR family transcriptional regulator [Brevibacterium]|uniref:DNA-binding transcriptional regulator, MarR family n=1 Tax=Brevibacterium antiquum CNRZ 918 TaxID=1255637 RepID=A0A2H1K301_9MICO|nr:MULTISPECIES: MarR family transcriptional regulator [Brevibacterium]SMX93938.1 DNA-binding transcriptional regulator, MarR family [Brevibacterium antiquum CNRZ 918]HCG55638.1 transcriptional regulator [Brevibacterium sp.]